MKLAKWGNSLALRIPAEVVEKLKLAPGEEVELRVTGEHEFQVSQDRRREEAIEALRKLRRPLPPGYKFNREELHDRELMRRLEENAERAPIHFWTRTFWFMPIAEGTIERLLHGNCCSMAEWLACRC